MRLRHAAIAAAVGLTLAIAGATAAVAPAAGPHICKGSLKKPGVLKGTYRHGVLVKGVCAVNSGKAHVFGTLTVSRGSALVAAFGRHHSRLRVTGDLIVGKGATVFLGCKVNPSGSGLPCFDDPNPGHPTLRSHGVITGSLIENSPLGVVVHNASIGKNVNEVGGGGGVRCQPPKRGIFASGMSPVYSDYEDTSVGRNVTIRGLRTCWLGINRVKIHRNLTLRSNNLRDIDGIEVLANHIGNNLSCHRNKHPRGAPSGTKPVWDNADLPPTFAEYPRVSEPNKVGGKRSGQCVKASPDVRGGPPGAKKF